MRATVIHSLALLTAALLGGCRGSVVNFEAEKTLPPGGFEGWIIDPPKQEQKIVVSVESSGPVDVLVTPTDDPDAPAQKAAKVTPLAKVENEQSPTLEATVPKGQWFQVTVRNRHDKEMTVKVKVRSK